MSKRLSGKVAVITASTDGIGLAIAQRLASEGCSVVVSSRKLKNVIRAVSVLRNSGYTRVHGCKCHVGIDKDRKTLFREAISMFGRLDIFISNAAVNPAMGKMLDCPESTWDKIFDINVRAAFLMAKDVVPIIKEFGGGSIIFISSVAAYNPMKDIGAYSVSKTALIGLTKVLSQSLMEDHIKVNCIAPGFVKTKSSELIIAKK